MRAHGWVGRGRMMWGAVFMFAVARMSLGAGLDPVPPEEVPGAGVAGTVVVDDGDAAVTREPPAQPTKVAGSPEYSPSFGGTALQLNGWNQIGDGKTTIAVNPKLSAGRYAVWVRFARLERNWHGNSDRTLVTVHAKGGDWEYNCVPRQGGQWVLLGVHELAGKSAALTMVNANMKGVVMLDGAVFVPAALPQKRGPRTLPTTAPGLATVIRRAAEVAIGPTEDPPADAVVAQRLRGRDFNARAAWDTLIRTPGRKYLWGDTQASSSYFLTQDAGRLAAMAAAWAGASEIDGSGMRGNPKLLEETLAAMDTFLTQRWTPTTKWDVNWWDFEIGVPRGVMSALCVLGDRAPPELKAKAFASMEHFTADPWKYYNKGFEATGANRIWMVQIHLRRAALAGDEEGLERCRDALPAVLAYVDSETGKVGKSRDGWWRDGSFIQHEKLPYVGAYGVLLIPDMIECMTLLEGTPWELKSPERSNLARWVDDHLMPVEYEGELFPRTTGRTAGSSGVESANQWLAMALCEMRPLLSKEQSAVVTARLRRWIDAGSFDAQFERANFDQFLHLHAIATDPKIAPAGPYVASRTHAAVDLALHHRPGWAASVAMSSTRVAGHEALWGANFRGWNQGEGVLMVHAGDPLRYRGGFWALVDPYRLPGITTNTWQLPDHDGGGGSPGRPSKEDFVGGASVDDVASVAAMRVGRAWSSLEARKGWFLLPDAVVCLGSGITAKDGRPCETIVESARLEQAGQTFLVDGKDVGAGDWKGDLSGARTVFLKGSKPERSVGWFFPQAQKGLAGERGERKGSWANAMKGASEAPIAQPWLSMVLTHGVDPDDATYQYVVLPGVTAEALAALSAKSTIEVLACDPKVQAVRDAANGITGVIFFEAGSAGPVTADAPCIVLLRESKEGTSLAVVDPTQKLGRVAVTLKVRIGKVVSADGGVKVTGGDPVRVAVDLAGANGGERCVRWAR